MTSHEASSWSIIVILPTTFAVPVCSLTERAASTPPSSTTSLQDGRAGQAQQAQVAAVRRKQHNLTNKYGFNNCKHLYSDRGHRKHPSASQLGTQEAQAKQLVPLCRWRVGKPQSRADPPDQLGPLARRHVIPRNDGLLGLLQLLHPRRNPAWGQLREEAEAGPQRKLEFIHALLSKAAMTRFRFDVKSVLYCSSVKGVPPPPPVRLHGVGATMPPHTASCLAV